MNCLTDNEKQLLAREVAADKECSHRGNIYRGAFIAGWDAAMEYMNAERQVEPAKDPK